MTFFYTIVYKETSDKDSGKERSKNTDEQGSCKTLNRATTEEQKYQRCQTCSDIRV